MRSNSTFVNSFWDKELRERFSGVSASVRRERDDCFSGKRFRQFHLAGPAVGAGGGGIRPATAAGDEVRRHEVLRQPG